MIFIFIYALASQIISDSNHTNKFKTSNNTYIDTQRPHMLHIGDYVKITRNVTILCHDYSRAVSCNIPGKENIGEAKETYIGDNVFIGMNAIVLMGAHIGDNCIVGAGSVVGGFFPENVVIAGNPGKIICSLDEFEERRKYREIQSAKEYVACWRAKYDRDPTIEEMTDAFAWLYLPHTKETMRNYPKLFRFGGDDHEIIVSNFLNSKSIFQDFDEFYWKLNICLGLKHRIYLFYIFQIPFQ